MNIQDKVAELNEVPKTMAERWELMKEYVKKVGFNFRVSYLDSGIEFIDVFGVSMIIMDCKGIIQLIEL